MNTKSKLKVLFVIDTLQVGGAERSMLVMAPFLESIELVVCHVYIGDQLKEDYERAGIKVYSFDVKGNYSFWKGYQKLKRIVLKEQPDLLHTSLLRSSLISRFLAHRLKIPLVCSLVADSYSDDRYQRLSYPRKLKLKVFKFLDRITVPWCDAFVSISRSIAATNALALQIPREKITVIYRGRDSKRFSCPVGATSHGGQPFKFISIGRLIPSKGHEILIQAFATESLRQKELQLTVVGEGPERKRLQELIYVNELDGKVNLVGEQQNVIELLSQSNGFLFPSYYEGLGGSLIEAMMIGLPVICSDIPVFQELIQHNTSGLKAGVGDPEDWARKIALLVNDNQLATRLGENAKHIASEKFDIRTIASQYIEFYNKVHEDHSARYKEAV